MVFAKSVNLFSLTTDGHGCGGAAGARPPLPNDLGFKPHPGGMSENSPTLQRWVKRPKHRLSPEGTADLQPIFHLSLRDSYYLGGFTQR